MLKRKHAFEDIFELSTKNVLIQSIKLSVSDLVVEADLKNFIGSKVPVEIRIGAKRFFGVGEVIEASELAIKSIPMLKEKKVESEEGQSSEKGAVNDKD